MPRTIAVNRKARHDYEILETYEAGIELRGTEVKSIKAGMVSLDEGYVEAVGEELFLVNVHVAPWPYAAPAFQHEPRRPRKLLLHKREIKRLLGKLTLRGLTLIPLKVYEVRGLIKVEIALVRGRRKHEKRQKLLEKAQRRDIARDLGRW